MRSLEPKKELQETPPIVKEKEDAKDQSVVTKENNKNNRSNMSDSNDVYKVRPLREQSLIDQSGSQLSIVKGLNASPNLRNEMKKQQLFDPVIQFFKNKNDAANGGASAQQSQDFTGMDPFDRREQE